MESHTAAAACGMPFNFLKRGSDHLIKRHVLPSAFLSPMERTPEKGLMSHSLQSFPTRTWQGEDQSSGGTALAATNAPPLLSNAASSGFSLSDTRPPSSTATPCPSQPFLNLNQPTLYVIHPSEYTSQQQKQHHHLMNRSQPPQ